jgi:AraC-like DNA-binding protein
MKSPLFEDFDYVHHVADLDPALIRECDWGGVFGNGQAILQEFPIHLRRERYDIANEIVHRHLDFLALYVVRGGRGVRVANGHPNSVVRGDVFLMSPGTTHHFKSPIDLTVDAVYFRTDLWTPREWEILGELPDMDAYITGTSTASEKGLASDHFVHLSPEPHARVEAVFAEMRLELAVGGYPQYFAARGRFSALLVQLAQWRVEQTFKSHLAPDTGVIEILSFCESNFHRELSNEMLAGMMNFSVGHFREVFVKEVGVPPGAYVQHLRLEHARKLLADKSLPVADVARLSGFGDSSRLGRAFKKVFGVSPLEFRKKPGSVPGRRTTSGLDRNKQDAARA